MCLPANHANEREYEAADLDGWKSRHEHIVSAGKIINHGLHGPLGRKNPVIAVVSNVCCPSGAWDVEGVGKYAGPLGLTSGRHDNGRLGNVLGITSADPAEHAEADRKNGGITGAGVGFRSWVFYATYLLLSCCEAELDKKHFRKMAAVRK